MTQFEEIMNRLTNVRKILNRFQKALEDLKHLWVEYKGVERLGVLTNLINSITAKSTGNYHGKSEHPNVNHKQRS